MKAIREVLAEEPIRQEVEVMVECVTACSALWSRGLFR